jgi:hypothetical protein
MRSWGNRGRRSAGHTVVVTMVHLQDTLGVLDCSLPIASIGSTEDNVEQKADETPSFGQTPEVSVDLTPGTEAVFTVETHDSSIGLGNSCNQEIKLLLLRETLTRYSITERLQAGNVAANSSGDPCLSSCEVRLGSGKKTLDLVDGTALWGIRSADFPKNVC